MNTVTIAVEIFPKHKEEFIQTIKFMNEQCKNEKGFKRSILYQDTNEVNHFNLVQELETQDDLEQHIRSETFRALLGALKLLSKHSKIEYNLVSPRSVEKVQIL